MRLIAALIVLAFPAVSSAAPEGFRLSVPLTLRAVKVGANPVVTVHCARTTAIWRSTASSEEAAEAAGRTNSVTREIMLPPASCLPLEKWLRGKTVDRYVLADAMFTFAHELGHAAPGLRDELAADCYATRKFNAVARAFGVKRQATLTRLRNDAPLVPQLC
jgi:hypothetical protein